MKQYIILLFLIISTCFPAICDDIEMVKFGKEEFKIPVPEGYELLPGKYSVEDPRLNLYQVGTDGLFAILVPKEALSEYASNKTPNLTSFYILGSPVYMRDKFIDPDSFKSMTRQFSTMMGTEELDKNLVNQLLSSGAIKDKEISVKTEKVHTDSSNIVSGIMSISCYLPDIKEKYNETKTVSIILVNNKIYVINIVSLKNDLNWVKKASDSFLSHLLKENSQK